MDANLDEFFKGWSNQALENWSSLRKDVRYKESYYRLCCLQQLKQELVVPQFTPKSAAFFIEAHNDALISHVSACFGAWRPALHALRSCLENALCAVFYKDHPVEMQLWDEGHFWIGFSEICKYLKDHPVLRGMNSSVTGLSDLKSEYATLSKATHASAADFRMTDPAASVLLWSTDPVRVGMWASRERKVIEAISLIIVCLYHKDLQGTKHTRLREMLYFAISSTKRNSLKGELRISIHKPH